MPLYVWRLVRNGAPGVMPNRALFFYPRNRPSVPPVYRYPLSLFRRSALRSRAHPRPTFSPYLAPSRFYASTAFFSTRGKNARRPSIGRGDRWRSERRATPRHAWGWGCTRDDGERARGRVRAPPPKGVHISRGCRCWIPGVGLRSNWMEILLHQRNLGEP